MRFEHRTAKLHEFCEISVEGKKLVIREGPIADESSSKPRKQTFGYPFEATQAMRAEIDRRTKKKWQRVREEIPAEPGAARNPELEAALRETPDNADAALVYGDWLQAQGDPRGELIAAQHALAWAGRRAERAGSPRRRALAAEVARLRAPYDAQLRALALRFDLCAPDAERGRLQAVWGLGFIERARLAHDYFAGELGDAASLEEVLGAFLALPSARLLRELTLGLWRDSDGQCAYGGAFAALARARPPALRRLHVADFRYPREIEISWTDLGDLSPIWEALPGLRELELQAGSMELGRVRAPELRSFEVRTGGLSRASARAIAAAEWPRLERLVVWFGDSSYGAEAGVDDLRPILEGAGLPALRHLGLMNAEFADDLCRALADARVLGQLESLDLSLGMMSDAGAAALAGVRALGGLKELAVERNYLTAEGVQALRTLGPRLRADEQRTPSVWGDAEHRYVAVGE
jgi:uncharacterized protein (TIGR02996 family)